MNKMNSIDFQICQHVITAMTSKKYENSNYLFLEPVDLQHFPTYATIVKRPMDLGTVATHLKNGVYSTKQEFIADTTTCFENAELFHKDKPENRWIIEFALKMKKNMKKELKSAGKKYNAANTAAGGGGNSGGNGSSTTGATTKAPKSSKKLSLSIKGANRSSNKSPTERNSDGSAISTGHEKKKKNKLILQTGSGSGNGAGSNSSAGTMKSAQKPKFSLKLNTKTSSSSVQQTKSAASTSVASQPKTPSSSTSTSGADTSKKSEKKRLKLRIKSAPKATSSKSSTPPIPKQQKPAIPKISIPKQQKTVIPKITIPKQQKPAITKTSTHKAPTPKPTLKKSTPKPTTPKRSTHKSPTPPPSNISPASASAGDNTSISSSSENKSKSKVTSAPKSTPSGPSRGKELPSAIAAKKASSKKESALAKANAKKDSNVVATAATKAGTKREIASAKSSTKKDLTITTSSKSSVKKDSRKGNRTPKAKSVAMTPKYKAQCSKILSSLKQRELKMGAFMKPVKNLYKSIDDYQTKVPIPMDISTMTTKLEKKMYASVADFVHDLRRIFANCLRYNMSSSVDPLRDDARKMLSSTEGFLHLFMKNVDSSKTLYPRLLYCWEKCLEILDTVLDLKNPDDGGQTAYYFIYPVSFFLAEKQAQAYKDKIKCPMDFGTINGNLIEGNYQSVEAFVKDCRLVTSNCKAYYQDEENGTFYVAQATRLENFLSPRLDAVLQYDRSEKGMNARKNASVNLVNKLLKPPKIFYTSMLNELRSSTYTDKYTKINETASLQFEHSVDTSMFKDYLQFVDSPMDLKTVEGKISMGAYEYPEDFEYDVNLIFKNCEVYNIPKQNHHIVNLAKHCARVFRKMYSSRIKVFEGSGGTKLFGEDKKDKKRPAEINSVDTNAPPVKKLKVESTSSKRKSPVPQVQNNQQSATRVKTVKTSGKTPGKTQAKRSVPKIIIRTDGGPVPRHVAIAKIKQGFTRRRHNKELKPWEEACSRFFRQLKGHPWVSKWERFVFDAPVPMLHPEIKEAYKVIIKKPMDLTTAEGRLLQGGIYNEPQEFIDDVALVFANAVIFNQSGHEQGDPVSMAYYDASKHLLRYTRWLSLNHEHLSAYLVDDSHSEGIQQSGPLPHWKLTVSNQKDARHEMENIVLRQPLDKSYEGHRFTWYEIECEKLLKSLRHQADHKRMSYFIRPQFPPDYISYISRPMEWESCNRNLQQRKYETFSDIITDLRLIFKNALKYNGRVKDTDVTSKSAYESALHMSGKLEAAIQRLYITAGDRIEREKVEVIINEREAEISEKVEKERLRTELQKEMERMRRSGNESSSRSASIQSVKIIQRRPARRDLDFGPDFDNPFTDQDNSYEQSEMEVLNKQKIMYENQQRDRLEMHRITRKVGVRVFHNLFWRSQAIYWCKDMSEKIQHNLSQNRILQVAAERNELEKLAEERNKERLPKASLVSSLLGNSSRSQVKIELSTSKRKQNKKKRKRLFFE